MLAKLRKLQQVRLIALRRQRSHVRIVSGAPLLRTRFGSGPASKNRFYQHILATLDPDLRVIDLDDVNKRAQVSLPERCRSVVRFSRIVRPKLSIRAGSMRISAPWRDFVESRAALARSRSAFS